MKKVLLSILFVLTTIISFAQSTISPIRGHVCYINSDYEKEDTIGAIINIQTSRNTTLAVGVSDISGDFSITPDRRYSGNITITVSHIGFEEYKISIPYNPGATITMDIVLKEDTDDLS